jgi:hypothetical protein
VKADEFAELAVPRLIWCARRGETITYRDLAAAVPGWTSGNARLAVQLRAVRALCNKRSLPDLTRLVVAQATGEPVEGDTDEQRRQEVFQNFRDYSRLGLYTDLQEVEPVA